jgi:hypothetical protein
MEGRAGPGKVRRVRLSGYNLFTVSSYTSETTEGRWGEGEKERGGVREMQLTGD